MSLEKRNRILVIMAGLVLVVGIAAVAFYLSHRNVVSTDDAFVDGHIVPIAAKVAGQVTSVAVMDNRAVKQGDVMVMIDPAPFEAALAEERAKLASAEAEANRSASDARRYAELYKKDEVSAQQLDNVKTAAAAARAAMERERASVQQAELNLSYTKLVAPASGTVTRKSVEPGMYVQVGQTLLSIVPSEVWVTANFKETQLTDIRPQQPVKLKVDAYPDKELSGKVDSIQLGTGARFSLFPPENATGNFVKVVQRVPVKIMLDETVGNVPTLAPGMSVEVTVNTR